MNAVTVENLCFGYEEREVLHNVNLAIPERDFAIIVGPNGGGKSTLLKLMLGLLKPRYGTVKIFGDAPEKQLCKLGYVPQSLQYDPNFPIDVLETVLLGRIERHCCGGFDQDDRRIALKALAEVGLAGREHDAYSELSGGQRQRVLIAQALASEPQMLLLDEPGANLDTPGVHTIYSLLKQLSERLTIVMVSHNLSMVESFAKHVICVNHTVDMHDISEVSGHELQHGDWIHIFHEKCPVCESEFAAHGTTS